MTPETENKINNMHDTLLIMKTQWQNHLERHPEQPCPGLMELKAEVNEVKSGAWKYAMAAIVALIGTVYKFVVGG
jgi:hypothetical protein